MYHLKQENVNHINFCRKSLHATQQSVLGQWILCEKRANSLLYLLEKLATSGNESVHPCRFFRGGGSYKTVYFLGFFGPFNHFNQWRILKTFSPVSLTACSGLVNLKLQPNFSWHPPPPWNQFICVSPNRRPGQLSLQSTAGGIWGITVLCSIATSMLPFVNFRNRSPGWIIVVSILYIFVFRTFSYFRDLHISHAPWQYPTGCESLKIGDHNVIEAKGKNLRWRISPLVVFSSQFTWNFKLRLMSWCWYFVRVDLSGWFVGHTITDESTEVVLPWSCLQRIRLKVLFDWLLLDAAALFRYHHGRFLHQTWQCYRNVTISKTFWWGSFMCMVC